MFPLHAFFIVYIRWAAPKQYIKAQPAGKKQ
jgi:hypothetical protein